MSWYQLELIEPNKKTTKYESYFDKAKEKKITYPVAKFGL